MIRRTCIAPTVVLSGQVRVGGSCVLHGAVLAADSGPWKSAAGGFLPFVFGIDSAPDRGEQMRAAMRRYASFLSRTHGGDELVR